VGSVCRYVHTAVGGACGTLRSQQQDDGFDCLDQFFTGLRVDEAVADELVDLVLGRAEHADRAGGVAAAELTVGGTELGQERNGVPLENEAVAPETPQQFFQQQDLRRPFRDRPGRAPDDGSIAIRRETCADDFIEFVDADGLSAVSRERGELEGDAGMGIPEVTTNLSRDLLS
jgi:hypothetical protein